MSNHQIALNAYQKLMLRLNKLAPYNAIHAVSIKEGKDNLHLLSQSINKVIQRLGIGNPEFSFNYQSVTYNPLIEPIQLIVQSMTLEAHIEREMNYHFSINEFPLRLFIILDQSQLYFSITYNHWIGDAFAIYQLIESIFADWQEETLPNLTVSPVKIEDAFKQIYQNKTVLYRCLGIVQSFFKFARGFRTATKDPTSTTSGCHVHFFDQDVTEKLLLISRSQGITINDLFVTLLAQLFGNTSQIERKKQKQKWFKPKRDRIIIAIMSNIRAYSLQPLSHVFGLFLGFFYISFKSPETASFHTLSQKVHRQTMRSKQKHTAIKQYLLFDVQNKIWDKTVRESSQYRLFNKNTPITVGVSNMNLTQNDIYSQRNAERYIRFSPTSMVCPIVFNITTFNGYLSLGINYRTTCYTSSEVSEIKDQFVLALNQLIVNESLQQSTHQFSK